MFAELDMEISHKNGTYRDGEVLARLQFENKDFCIFVGVSSLEKRRMLLISILRPLTKEIMEQFPNWQGVKIFQKQFSQILHKYNQWFVIIEQETNVDHEIYEVLIKSICEKINLSISSSQMLRKLYQVLEQWKFFFSNQGNTGLSLEAQQGLFGELLTIKKLLEADISPGLIQYWNGPLNEDADFRMGNLCIEVKTTGKNHSRITVSNERQLSPAKDESFFLLAYKLKITNDEEAQNLNLLVGSVRDLLHEWPRFLDEFNAKLIMAGYHETQAHRYNTKYQVVSQSVFKVEETFPSIREDMIPAGISNVSYVLDLDSCFAFSIDNDHLYKEVQEKLV